MSEMLKLYWDASCFICLLKSNEHDRAEICRDILKNGDLGNVQIFTSIWSVVEVVRPTRPGTEPLPAWAEAAIKAIEKSHPDAQFQLETLWRRYQSDQKLPKLTAEEIAKVEGMFFGWTFLKLIRFDQRIARYAVELQQDRGLGSADSIHAASAIKTKGISELQAWDRDYKKVGDLITVTKPTYISPAGSLYESIADGHHSSGIIVSEKPKATDEGGSGKNDS